MGEFSGRILSLLDSPDESLSISTLSIAFNFSRKSDNAEEHVARLKPKSTVSENPPDTSEKKQTRTSLKINFRFENKIRAQFDFWFCAGSRLIYVERFD